MKHLISFFFLISSIIASAQDISGTYQFESSSSEFKLIRTLELFSDGTFEYYNYRFIEKGMAKETHIYGRGTWTQNKKIITFTSNDSDLNEKFTLDFNGTKARYISKSPRDKSDRVIETAIQFYETEIDILKGLKFILK